jgi:hypothetical protein
MRLVLFSGQLHARATLMKVVNGWWIHYPYFLLDEPSSPEDIVSWVEDFECDPEHVCPIEDKAWRLAERYLLEHQKQAQQDVASLVTALGMPRRWLEQAQRHLRIVETGLRLCAERSAIQPARSGGK